MSKQKYRRNHASMLLCQLFILVGFLFASTLIMPASASGQSIAPSKPIKQNRLRTTLDKIAELSKIAQEKQKAIEAALPAVEQVQKEAEEVNAAKDSLAAEVDTIKSELERLENMFVKINRYASDASGNMYAAGNCTWYAKSMRADISNSWGNANTWYSRAKAQGWKVGDTPKKGAVATTTSGRLGHVAYVIGVSADGTQATIREMNYKGLYSMNTRTVHYTEFKYIYQLD